MKIQQIKISNFRGIDNISFNPGSLVSVIVGPNAVGKSTIFEAIRLAKVLLAPSYNSEIQETLQDMRAWSPFGSSINFDALVGDKTSSSEIEIEFTLSDEDLQRLTENDYALKILHVRNTIGVPPNSDELSLVQFLSSPQGQAHLTQAGDALRPVVDGIKQSKIIRIGLSINPTTSQISGTNLIDQEILTVLCRSLPPTSAYLNYFPADRNMPLGEVAIQIGTGDTQEQMRSHLAQPGKKYQRLKNFIVSQTLLSQSARATLEQDFHLVFRELLPGKTLDRIEVSIHGQITALIRETARDRTFDIDNMSSGEKGLVLLFTMMLRCVTDGGIILIDEPELHLNPSVCKKILPFIIENIAKPLNAQILLTTHSPEILGQAYDRHDCSLFHLRGRRDISAIYPQDKAEVFEALKRLGVQTSDVLFNKGTINVEGSHDIDLLEVGFQARIHGYKVTAFGGRNEIEKEIKALQTQENKGQLNSRVCFIFDLDRKPTSLESSPLVRITQWGKYCFENYLLDADAIFDACAELRRGSSATNPVSRGELPDLMKNLALAQIRHVAAQDAYRKLAPEGTGLRPSEIEKFDNFDDIGHLLVQRLESVKNFLAPLQREEWLSSYIADCKRREEELKTQWEPKWSILCDGKSLLDALRTYFKLNVSSGEFKRAILKSMARAQTDSWRVVDSILSDLISGDA
ncbi:ATP-dependent nuclease [Burkholderia vietnamiensis]|jgi:predicted ATP-dependent endonuclease of OLD family|uniref:ATP-dependent nuclease n=1 Tax=Burkholderia vietnamiensis TaxID=60552 RepID=UPI0010418CDC|nr:ATP-binding protein [Burkholderia vietnamiensis]